MLNREILFTLAPHPPASPCLSPSPSLFHHSLFSYHLWTRTSPPSRSSRLSFCAFDFLSVFTQPSACVSLTACFFFLSESISVSGLSSHPVRTFLLSLLLSLHSLCSPLSIYPQLCWSCCHLHTVIHCLHACHFHLLLLSGERSVKPLEVFPFRHKRVINYNTFLCSSI